MSKQNKVVPDSMRAKNFSVGPKPSVAKYTENHDFLASKSHPSPLATR